jgi:hypothetical protein
MLDEPDPVALEDGHHGDDQGMTGTLEESDFMASLESELSSLVIVPDRMGWLLDGEEIVSASDFVNLSGEGEVFEELNVEQIVELVLTEGQDKIQMRTNMMSHTLCRQAFHRRKSMHGSFTSSLSIILTASCLTWSVQ